MGHEGRKDDMKGSANPRYKAHTTLDDPIAPSPIQGLARGLQGLGPGGENLEPDTGRYVGNKRRPGVGIEA